MNDPLAALIATHRAVAEQARADGDPGRANLHDWAADQADHFQKEQTRCPPGRPKDDLANAEESAKRAGELLK